jgi:glycogen synthase
VDADSGNGFLFKTFDSNGLFWAINEAMKFHGMPAQAKARQIKRVMAESTETFTYERSARQYIELYEDAAETIVVEG